MSDPHIAVMVSLNGDEIVTIETNCLSGGDIGEREEEAIRWAIDHLSAFIADKRDADATAAAHLAGRIEQAREDAKILAEQLAEATRKAKKLAESKRLRGQWIVSAYTEAYDKGHAAYSADEPLIANPYLSGAFKALAWAWAYGWLDAQTEDRGIGGTG